jgi:hypothetical protein
MIKKPLTQETCQYSQKGLIYHFFKTILTNHYNMNSINYFCNAQNIELNAAQQLLQYAENQYIEHVCAFTDIHFCDEKAIPVGVAFSSKNYFYPLVTGKDIGCGVMYLKIAKSDWLRPFDKKAHYRGLHFAHTQMTDTAREGNFRVSIRSNIGKQSSKRRSEKRIKCVLQNY